MKERMAQRKVSQVNMNKQVIQNMKREITWD